jgi:NADH:ubiquinone oxidoreductase subunit 3 (subunit A)
VSLLLVIVGLGVLAVVLVFVLLVSLGRRDDVVPTREWELVRACRVVAVVLGVVLASASMQHGDLGATRAPAIFGGCVVLGVAIGETLVRPDRRSGPRTASLRTRRFVDYLPRPLAGIVTSVLAALVATLAFTTLTASRDASGERRALECASRGLESSMSPYPGSYYSLPLAAVLLAVLLVAAFAAHQVVRRPRGLATTEHGDDVLRARSLTVLVAAVGVAVAFSQAGVGLTAGAALDNFAGTEGCAPGWVGPVSVVLLISALLALLAGLWCLVRIVSNDIRPSSLPRAEAAGR